MSTYISITESNHTTFAPNTAQSPVSTAPHAPSTISGQPAVIQPSQSAVQQLPAQNQPIIVQPASDPSPAVLIVGLIGKVVDVGGPIVSLALVLTAGYVVVRAISQPPKNQ